MFFAVEQERNLCHDNSRIRQQVTLEYSNDTTLPSLCLVDQITVMFRKGRPFTESSFFRYSHENNNKKFVKNLRGSIMKYNSFDSAKVSISVFELIS